MQQFCGDWDSEHFPEVLDGELDNALRQTQQFSPWMHPVLLVAFGFFGIKMYHDLQKADVSLMAYVIILTPLLLLGLVLVRLQFNASSRFGENIRERIIHSGLLARLPQASDWLGGIYDWTPAGFARIFVGQRPTNMKGWGRVLTWNLDWYLDAPRRYVRPEWYLAMVMAVVGVLFIVFFPIRPDPHRLLTMGLTMLPTVYAFFVVASHFIFKKRKMMEVFRELLNHGVPPKR